MQKRYVKTVLMRRTERSGSVYFQAFTAAEITSAPAPESDIPVAAK
jgi:hypothetical protein